MVLSSELFSQARSFIVNDAREIERVRFLYEFESGSPDDVASALAKYQNADGGFGHALEPDLRCPESSALATSIGLRVLSELPSAVSAPLVERAEKWLEDNWDEEHCCWPIIGPEANHAPRAPWWNCDESTASKSVFNPAGDIVSTARALNIADKLIDKSLAKQVQALETATELDDHDLICLTRLVDSKILSDQALIDTISQAISRKVSRTPDDLANYGLRPRFAISDPTSVFYHNNQEAVEMELAYLINGQTSNGSWIPNWSWFGQFEDVWPIAYQEWCGAITFDTLKWLKEFGLLKC